MKTTSEALAAERGARLSPPESSGLPRAPTWSGRRDLSGLVRGPSPAALRASSRGTAAPRSNASAAPPSVKRGRTKRSQKRSSLPCRSSGCPVSMERHAASTMPRASSCTSRDRSAWLRMHSTPSRAVVAEAAMSTRDLRSVPSPRPSLITAAAASRAAASASVDPSRTPTSSAEPCVISWIIALPEPCFLSLALKWMHRWSVARTMLRSKTSTHPAESCG
mmetsp:Transcript_14622/g.49514  ORF Transcript_14622/g.49514 Transcript_14622/m.49514 type:complete len:221 (-) Transcript_14622:749-1411(-)